MSRITCATPSNSFRVKIVVDGVPIEWTTIASPHDFSVPDPQQLWPARDPLDASRAVRPGELFFTTPIKARNKTATTRWIEARIFTETADIILMERIFVPPNETVQIVTQGMSLIKRVRDTSEGDLLQLRAETASTFDIFGMAQQRPTAEHIGVE